MNDEHTGHRTIFEGAVDGVSVVDDDGAYVDARLAAVQSDDRFRRMLDALELLALVTDVDGRTTFMNRAMLSILGVELDQVLGEQFALSQPGGDAQHAAYLAVIASEELASEWENEIVVADGSRRCMRWTSAFVRDARGRIEAVASVGEDVTMHRELEEQVRHAVRVESLGRLAGGVAHDFNNFLAVVLGHAEMLSTAPELTASSRDHLDHITAGLESASRLTRQLLAFGCRQVMDACDVSVSSALDHLRTMLAPTLGATVALEVVPHTDDDVVFIDPSQLDQVLVNLAMNARDAMPQGGTLRFEVTTSEIDDAAAARLGLSAGRYVILTVSDTGDGIPAELVDHIFEPFVTTKPVGVGTGLGLSTAYSIITQSGGAITVSSRHGHGATFTIHLPIRHRTGTLNPTTAHARLTEQSMTPTATGTRCSSLMTTPRCEHRSNGC